LRIALCVPRIVGVFCIVHRLGLQINLNSRAEVITFRQGTREFAISFLTEFQKGLRCEDVHQIGVQQM